MKLPRLLPVYTIRLVYKSGYTHNFEVYTFSIDDNNTWKWSAVSKRNSPVAIGITDIVAIWTIGVRKKLCFI